MTEIMFTDNGSNGADSFQLSAFSSQLSVLSGRLIIPPSQALAALVIGELS